MFKRLETAWNARTPKILHNGSKENIIFQFTLVGVIIAYYTAKIKWMERQDKKFRDTHTPYKNV